MPVAAVTAGLAVASFVGGRSDAKKARAFQQQQLTFQKEQLAFARERYAKNEALYGETKRKLVDAANEGVTADLQGVTDRASSDVARSFEKSQQEADRNLASYGINPNSARAMAVKRGGGIAKAAAESGLINVARRDEKRYAEDTTWNRREAVSRLGVQEGQFDFNGVNNAGNNVANAYGNMADSANRSAAAAYQTAGQFAGFGLSQMGGAPAAAPATGGWTAQMNAMDQPAANGLSYTTPDSPYNFQWNQ